MHIGFRVQGLGVFHEIFPGALDNWNAILHGSGTHGKAIAASTTLTCQVVGASQKTSPHYP